MNRNEEHRCKINNLINTPNTIKSSSVTFTPFINGTFGIKTRIPVATTKILANSLANESIKEVKTIIKYGCKE